MRRRSRAGGEQVKTRRRKTVTLKRRNAPKVAHHRESFAAGRETEVARLTKELREAREQQTATAELLRIISSSPTDAQPVFDTIVRNFVSLCGSIFGTIFTFDSQLVHFAGAYGFSSEQLNAFRTKYPVHVNDRSVISARAILARAPVHIHDIRSDPYYDREHAAAGGEWRRMLGVPMLREGVPLGAIVAAWSEAGAIPKQHEDLLKVFAAQAVIAIENVRLFEAEQQRTRELSESLEQQTATSEVLRVISSSAGDVEPVFQTMLANAVRICDAKFGILWRYDNEAFDPVALFGAPEGLAEFVRQRGRFQPSAGTALDLILRTKDVVRISDAMTEPALATARRGGARSLIIIPMLKDNVLIGAITIYRQEVRPFTDKQVELIRNFAAQAVIAIENARLLDDLNKLNQQLEQRVTDQVGEIERMGRLRRFLPPQVADLIVASGTEKQLLMALDMRTAIGGMIEKWRDLGHDLGFGIGIAHGFATLGTIGFEGRFDYAAIGTVSNVASRLCDEAKPGQMCPRRLAGQSASQSNHIGNAVPLKFAVEIRFSFCGDFDRDGVEQHRDCGHERDGENVAEQSSKGLPGKFAQLIGMPRRRKSNVRLRREHPVICLRFSQWDAAREEPKMDCYCTGN